MFNAGLTPMLKAPVRRCVRAWRRIRYAAQTAPTARKFDADHATFLCNVCGTASVLPRTRISREDGACRKCQCFGRLRSMMYAVTAHFSPDQPVLAWMIPRKDIRGVGCSDWGYAGLLAEKFNYVNTFFDHEPRLDLCNMDSTRWAPGSVDFITCTDVLEHVEPPLERAFDGMRRLLKPGGVAILTAPTTLETANREHFPSLNDWKIVQECGRRALVNRRADGTIERFEDLCFHGGEGMTLEFRVFSRQGLIDAVEKAGLRVARIYDESVPGFALPLSHGNFVLVAKKEV